jgi:hypothetical protein
MLALGGANASAMSNNMREKIGVSTLKDVQVLYKGDIYDLACLLLKVDAARDKGTGSRTRYTVHGLATSYSLLTRIDRDEILKLFERYKLPLGATVEYDEDIA